MKPFLLIILALILALALLASCMYTNLSGNASQAAETQTYTTPMLTAPSGPTPTADTVSPIIFYDLNMTIEDMERLTKFNELEHITGASYQVIGVDFPPENNSSLLRVKTRCECAQNAQCCSPTRTFVVTLMAMDNSDIMGQVPMAVTEMQVWCYDHATLTDVMSVSWADVKEFINGNITGFQLAFKVTPQPH